MSVGRFTQVMGAPELHLDEACLAIAGALQAPIDEIDWLAAIDLLAGECPTPTAEGIVRHLCGDLGFRGNTAAYYDWRNSCLDRVIERRRGIPITLSVVVIEVAKRLGVRLEGIGMPSHFLVGVPGEGRYFDPFGGGAELDADDAQALFDRLTGGKIGWNDHFLDPTPGDQIVVRMLNNLRSIFEARGDELRLGVVMQLRARIPELAEREAAEIAMASAVFN